MNLSFSRFATVRRADRSEAHPSTIDPELPAWVGTDDDPVWVTISAEIAQFTPIKEVSQAAHQCQVDVARLAAFADARGPVAEATSQALLGLVIDIHHECRRIRSVEDHNNSHLSERRSFGIAHLWQWLTDPVGSGEPVSYQDLDRLRRTHRQTAFLRFVFAMLTGGLLATGSPRLALLCLLPPVAASGLIRYRTNAEAAVTFRARYLSCVAGHLGDTAVLLGAFTWSAKTQPFPISIAPVLALVGLLLGTSVRTGALQVGVHVPRLRMERVVRIVAFSTGIALTAAHIRQGFLFTLAIVLAFVGHETVRVMRGVWGAGGSEFAWAVRTDAGITSEMFAAPVPDRSDEPDNGLATGIGAPSHV